MRSCKTSVLLLALAGLAVPLLVAQQKPLHEPDVVFVPTPQRVVDEMLKMANVHAGDITYDLGCGDGRLAISAAKLGAKATGIDINPVRIRESQENAAAQGMTGKVTFRLEDLFEADFHDATVVTLYLLPSLNVKLRPKLWQLKPGTRIVSHDFDMGDWTPEKTADVDGHTIYFWTVPAPQPAAQQKQPPEKLVFRGKTLAAVVFTHAGHLQRENGQCTFCHEKIWPQSTAVALASGKECHACHIEGGRAFDDHDKTRCVRCHSGPAAVALAVPNR